MEEGYGPTLLSKTMTGAMSYHSLEEECNNILLGGQIKQEVSITALETNPF